MIWLSIAAAVFAAFVAMSVYYRRRPPEMSESGQKHFKTGLLFAVISSAIFALLCLVVNVTGDTAPFAPFHPLNFWIVLAGFVCNGISLFSFARELMQLLPGSEASDVTPEGMLLGFVMGVAEIGWLMLGFGLQFAP